jgi:hypothetical protein
MIKNKRDISMIGDVFATLSNYLLAVLATSTDDTIAMLAQNELLVRSIRNPS